MTDSNKPLFLVCVDRVDDDVVGFGNRVDVVDFVVRDVCELLLLLELVVCFGFCQKITHDTNAIKIT